MRSRNRHVWKVFLNISSATWSLNRAHEHREVRHRRQWNKETTRHRDSEALSTNFNSKQHNRFKGQMFEFPQIQCCDLNYCNISYNSHLYSNSIVTEIPLKSQSFINQLGTDLYKKEWNLTQVVRYVMGSLLYKYVDFRLCMGGSMMWEPLLYCYQLIEILVATSSVLTWDSLWFQSYSIMLLCY